MTHRTHRTLRVRSLWYFQQPFFSPCLRAPSAKIRGWLEYKKWTCKTKRRPVSPKDITTCTVQMTADLGGYISVFSHLVLCETNVFIQIIGSHRLRESSKKWSSDTPFCNQLGELQNKEKQTGRQIVTWFLQTCYLSAIQIPFSFWFCST